MINPASSTSDHDDQYCCNYSSEQQYSCSGTLMEDYFYYEPTSVLDPNLAGSPAVPPDFTTLEFPSDDLSFLLPQKDDFAPPPLSFSDHDHLLNLLLRAASAIDSDEPTTAHLLLSHLNHLFPSVSGSSLQRSALHFKDSLLSLLSRPRLSSTDLPADLLHRVTAHKSFSDLSPVPQFSSFTTNQILLESLSSSSQALHIIDFDLGLGSQWSSFAEELAVRSRSSQTSPPSLRLTAIVPDDSRDFSLAADNLRDFTNALGLRFSVNLVRVAALGTLALSGIRFSPGEAVAAVLTPAIFQLLGSNGPPDATSTALLRFIRGASPRAVVFVDTEPCCSSPSPPSFEQGFASGVEFYSALLDSLDSAASATGLGDDSVRRIERFLIRPRITSTVGACGTRSTPWAEMFTSGGFSPAPFSGFTESQAEWLLRRAPVDGFHVARKGGSLVLSWHGRDLVATSAWMC